MTAGPVVESDDRTGIIQSIRSMRWPSRAHVRWYTREFIAAALCLAALGVAIAILFSQSRPRRFHLSISGGSAEGLRHQIAERLAADGVSHALSFRLVATSGSREALDLIKARKLDVAFVQGGLDPSFHPHVRQIAALHIEPLHLLVKSAEFKLVSESLAALKAKNVNLGPEGSGTHDLRETCSRSPV